MANDFHDDIVGTDIHVVHFKTFADATARTSEAYVTADIGKVVKQTDTEEYYVVISTAPTFKLFTPGVDADIKVAVDSGATADFLGATDGVGAIRVDDGIAKTDGGDFITLGVDIANESSATLASDDEFLIADVDDSNSIKKVTAQSIANLSTGTSIMDFSFFSQQHRDGIIVKETDVYIFVANFIFRGTTALGTPTAIKVISLVEDASNAASIKIFDVTNSLTIAEGTGFTNIVFAINDLGTLSNLSAGEAIWELQGKLTTDTKGDDLNIGSLSVYF